MMLGPKAWVTYEDKDGDLSEYSLLHLEEDILQNCEKILHRKLGWLSNKWVNQGGGYFRKKLDLTPKDRSDDY